MTTPSVGLVLVGAGSSHRMNGVDKIWAALGDHPILWHSVARFSPVVAASVLVVRSADVSRASALVRSLPRVSVVAGGADRRESVARGLHALSAVDVIAVHDVARPLASVDLLDRGLAALPPDGGAIPVLRLHDTVKSVDAEGRIMSTMDRERLRAIQTPQLFHATPLREVHGVASPGPATDDASLLEARGFPIQAFEGDPRNFKITSPFDLALARLLIDREHKS